MTCRWVVGMLALGGVAMGCGDLAEPGAPGGGAASTTSSSGGSGSGGVGPAAPTTAFMDFDGDGRTDSAVYTADVGLWELHHSSLDEAAQGDWGWHAAVPVPGDYDGDRIVDVAVFHPAEAHWYIVLSGEVGVFGTREQSGSGGGAGGAVDGTVIDLQWGPADSEPVVGDYDGDGKTDLALFEPLTKQWSIRRSSDRELLEGTSIVFGCDGCRPVPNVDYDGDGKVDLVVFDPATAAWHIRSSSSRSEIAPITWGDADSALVPGDYDGDGRTDLAVHDGRTAQWLIRLTADGSTMDGGAISFGPLRAWAVPGDYDGDGQTDLASYEPDDARWTVRFSSDGQTRMTTIGGGYAIPVWGGPPPRGGSSIEAIGEIEECGASAGVRPSIAVDSRQQPHIAVDVGDPWGAQMLRYHRIAGEWSEHLLANPSQPPLSPQSDIIFLPHLVIDRQDRAWISSWFFKSGVEQACGQGLWMFTDVATSPAESWFELGQLGVHGWVYGQVAVDPYFADRAFVMTFNGEWGQFDAQGQTLQTGEMFIGLSGEKLRFQISPRPDGAGIWHGVQNGYTSHSSSYQSSERHHAGEGPVTFADYGTYSSQGSDYCHPSLGVDRVDPEVAYIGSYYGQGLAINIWDGQQLVWGSSGLPVVDAEADSVHRWGPQWASAEGGGAFLCWSREGRVKLRHVAKSGTMGDEIDLCEGTNASIASDRDGHLHLAYQLEGGLRYRKILTR